MPDQIVVDPSQVQPATAPIQVDPSEVQPAQQTQVTSTFRPLTTEDPANEQLGSMLYAQPRPAGTPVMQVAPKATPGAPSTDSWLEWLGNQAKSGYFTTVAGMDHLAANIYGILDNTVGKIADATGLEKDQVFGHLQNYVQGGQQLAEQKAAEARGSDTSFGGSAIRATTSFLTSLPITIGAGVAGGAVKGFAVLGALENADQGWKASLRGAAEGALQGKFFEVIDPLGRFVKIPLAGVANYFALRGQGVDAETAASNSLVAGAAVGLLPGSKTTRTEVDPNAVARGLTTSDQDIANLQGGGPGGGGPGGPGGGGPGATRNQLARDVMQQGQKYGVRLSAGDIAQTPALKNIEISAEKVPGLGMQKFRAEQQLEAARAAAGLKGQYEEALIDASPSSIDELQKAAGSGDQRARNVLEKMNAAGNDPDRIIQASIGLGDWTTRQTATELYDRVQQLAEDHDLGDVPMDATGKAVNSSLQQLRPAKLPNNEVIGLLQKIKKSITPELDEEGKPVVDDQGNPVTPDNSYGLIRQLHSDLGERIREYYEGNNALIGEKGVGYLERVQNAIEDDMRNYAANSGVPEIVEAGDTADEYYKTARVPYKNGMLASAATSTEPDQIFQQFIKAGKGDRAQAFYNSLDDRGRAAVRYNMVAKAVDDAINPQSSIFSPQKFFTAVDKLDDAYGVFFTAQDKAEIQGFKNLMGHVTRAGQFAENPPTGQRVIPFLIAGGAVPAAKAAMAHPLMAMGGASLFLMARGLFTTVRGRNLLLRASGIRPGSPMMNSIYQQVAEQMPKASMPPEPPEGPPDGGGPPPPPPPGPPGGGGGAGPRNPSPAPAGSGEGAAPETPPAAGPPAPGGGGPGNESFRDYLKRAWKGEKGSLTLGNLRKADLAAGSEQSTRVPTAVKSTEDPLSNILTTGYESWRRDPAMMAKNVNAMLEYPNFHDLRDQVKSGALSIPDAAESIIGRIQENLQWLHDAMPAEFRDRARLWYDGANTIAHKWAGDYGSTPEQVAGTMAVTSPGTDWFVNAERARRLLEFWQDRDSKTWDPRMATTWRDKVSQAVPEQARGAIYKLIKGKSFNQVANDPDVAPIWFRLYDEAVNPREYPTLTPEGKAGDLARIGSGDPRQFSWSDFGQIEKALSILEDDSKQNIHQNLGQEHKVRNFYNNIINPDSPREHTTIDTHAVAAGLMRPLSQKSTEVGHNFGGTGSSSSSVSGESGTYGLHKEAYRRAAAANDLLPREMQSITWEAIRSMFSPQFKRNPANVEYINSLWRDVSSGKITADAARQRALQYGGGFDRPAWFKGRWNPAIPEAAGPSGQPR